MQINKTDNVIFLKGIESNLIEEAFIVLKSNIKLNIKENNQVGIQNKRIDILKEAELILSQEIEKNNQKYEKFRIRKLTPYETLKIQGFDKKFVNNVIKNGMSDTQLYKQAGNAVSVDMITMIANEILEILD